MTTSPCQHCGQELVPPRSGPFPRYCSAGCRNKARYWRLKAEGKRTPTEQRRLDEYVPRAIQMTCRYCKQDFVARRENAAHCGEPECKRLYRNHRMRYYTRQRRLKKKADRGPFFSSIEIFDRDGWICHICEEPVDRELQHPDQMSASVDHVIPLAAGGRHARENVRCAHLRCNQIKSDKI